MRTLQEENKPMKIVNSFPKVTVALLVTAGSTFALAAPLWAQGTSEERSSCMGDAFKFCSSDIPHVSKIEACLKTNMSKLSSGCRAEFEPAGKTKIHSSHFK
jgi:hypothetical protein